MQELEKENKRLIDKNLSWLKYSTDQDDSLEILERRLKIAEEGLEGMIKDASAIEGWIITACQTTLHKMKEVRDE